MAAEASVSPATGGGGSEKIHKAIEEKLIRFQRDNEQNSAAILYLYNIRFNCATVNHLTAFLCSGVKNRVGQPVNELSINSCTFESEESLCLLCDFFDSNKSPKTLEKIQLNRLRGGITVYECLLSSLHNNKTITELSLGDDVTKRGATGGKLVGNLLQQNNAQLTSIKFSKGPVKVAFISAMGYGVRSRLKSLGMRCVEMDNEALNELRLVYANNRGQNTILSELDLGYNAIEGHDGGNNLRQLLLTLPSLKKLDITFWNGLDTEGVSALFSDGMNEVMGRLQSLSMAFCYIRNVGLAQMASSVPDSAHLVHLDLGSNDIQGRAGGEALFDLLVRCGRLETLDLNANHRLGPDGARALAPALRSLCSLQKLQLSWCNIGDSATEILTSLTNASPCLKSLNLAHNGIPPATVASLIDFLNGTCGCLEELILFGNGQLLGQANVGQHGLFFDAIVKHKSIQRLDVREQGYLIDEEQLDGPLQSAVFKNRSLVTVNGAKAEYIRRDKLMALIQSTMSSGSTTIRLAVWPMALGICAPRYNQVGARPIFCLIQKMAEGDVFVHTKTVYRFEKVRASIRVQRWWRGQ